MDNRRHQAQNAAGSLETLQCRPVFVKAVEYFGVNRVAGHHPVPVLNFAGFKREVVLVLVIHLAEFGADSIPSVRVLAVKEQTAAHDFKALVRGNRLPDGLHAPEGMLDGLKRRFTRVSADFDIRFGDRRDHKAVLTRPCRFGHFLNEGDEIVESSGGQSVCAV